MDREKSVSVLQNEDRQDQCQGTADQSGADLLMTKRMPNERLERVRDVWCFCAQTGLAFTDAEHLRAEHISTDENGTQWIRKPREKTSVMSRIPLLPYPLKILAKYADSNLEGGKLLPVPSNQKMNAYLKEIAVICDIGKNLTTHVARHYLSPYSLKMSNLYESLY